ncbi:putative membrane protein [Paenibacillus algicola]|uniref:Putative membrane protein n=1 Tax=Paenibacillus algicola TaxID=2565926 RepID=A0A4P8XQR7_9BACL|nr:PTS sugar transporter [Paenibacillus algicola]QCT04695.1 putative membrane protein [Paenibacillus algicola]
MSRQIAIIGSSGGNLYNLGGKDPRRLLGEILIQMESADLSCAALQFIAAEASMDQAKPDTRATLYSWKMSQDEPVIAAQGTLQEVNEAARQLDQDIAEQISLGEIDGIIVMSADPEGTNRLVFEAAARHKIPVTGTGGTSMAGIQSRGVHVIAASGTTGTTNRTRAVTFVTSLCKHWRMPYRPVIGSSAGAGTGNDALSSPWKRINLRGIMMASLPGFIAMALILAASKVPGLSSLSTVFELMIKALPVILAVIAAKQVSELDEVSIVAGIVAGVLSTEGGIIGGIIGGIGAGLLVHYIFRKCVEWRFPATTVNIAAGGLAGLISGLAVYFLIAPIALAAGEGIRGLIEMLVSFSPAIAGLIAGLLIWPAIIGGVYHAAILPIVLLEMERTGNSFLGAVDMVGLVMVSAGITLANIVAPRDKGEAAVAAPGFAMNMGFGTFVEAAYPFMFSNKLVFGGAIMSAGLGGLLVGLFEVRGTAYVPSFFAPTLSNNAFGFTISMLASLLCSFLITVILNKLSLGRRPKADVSM